MAAAVVVEKLERRSAVGAKKDSRRPRMSELCVCGGMVCGMRCVFAECDGGVCPSCGRANGTFSIRFPSIDSIDSTTVDLDLCLNPFIGQPILLILDHCSIHGLRESGVRQQL